MTHFWRVGVHDAAAADRAERRRQLRAAGLLPFTALQRQVVTLDDVDDKEIV